MNFAILNYGVGNLFSIKNALAKLGVSAIITSKLGSARRCDAIILPGVGNFSEVALRIEREGIADEIKSGKFVLGICLGMQLFFEESEEGKGRGLSVLRGRVVKYRGVKVPQVGWNTVEKVKEMDVVSGVREGSWVYYVNSFYPEAENGVVAAESFYGVYFPAVIQYKNIVGTQFHPEKSGKTGLTILGNFVRMVRK